MKVCCACKISKPDTEFQKLAKASDGLSYRCKECLRQYHREWEASNPESVKRYLKNKADDYEKKRWHERRRFTKHGLTPETYNKLLEAQGGVCAICGVIPESTFRVDHDHDCCAGIRSCGRCVRGLLCLNCNASLGGLGDDPILLRKAADYIENFSVRASEPITLSGPTGPSGI